MVQKLEQHLLLDVFHHLVGIALDAGGVILLGRLVDALAHLLVGNALLLGPILDGQVEVEQAQHLILQARDIPLLGIGVLGDMAAHHLFDRLLAHVGDDVADILLAHEVAALLENDLALVVHHVVVFEDVLAGVEIAGLDLALRLFDRLVDPAVDDGLALLKAELLQHPVHAVGAEDAHQIVLQGQEELGAAGVALAAGAAAELIVDAPALMPLSADDVEAAGHGDGAGGARTLGRLDLHLLLGVQHDLAEALDLLADGGDLRGLLRPILHAGGLLPNAHVDRAAELDVGAAAGHVGGDGDGPGHAGLGHDVGLLLVEAGVQHGELLGSLAGAGGGVERLEPALLREVDLLEAGLLEQLRHQLGLLDRGRADQHGLHPRGRLLDLDDDRLHLLLEGPVDDVVLVHAGHGHVGGDLDHVELVDLLELLGLGGGGAGHAAELLVEAEIVLEGDRGERDVLGLDLHPLLGLERLVQAFRIAPPRHHAASELVDDDDLADALLGIETDDVVLVALEERVGAQRLVEVMDDRGVLGVVEVALLDQAGGADHLLELLGAGLGERDLALLLVEVVIDALDALHQFVEGEVELGAVLGRAGDDQGRARLVDQDGVDLVDDGVGVPALGHLREVILHVVAQIIEAELVVRAVGDVACIGLAALVVVQPMHDRADGEPEEGVDLPHPLGVALGQIVVDRDDVDAASGERVEVHREGGDERLALAGLHLGDGALVQHHAADHLHVVMALAERALGGLADGREGGDKQVIKLLAGGELLAESRGAGLQLIVREAAQFALEGVDGGDTGGVSLEAAVVDRAEQLLGKRAKHRDPIFPVCGRAAWHRRGGVADETAANVFGRTPYRSRPTRSRDGGSTGSTPSPSRPRVHIDV